MTEEEKPFSERVRNAITSNQMTIRISFPMEVYNEFKSFAKDESADCYWLAIKRLMEFYKGDLRMQLLSDKVDFLADKVSSFEQGSDEVESKRGVRKSFGKRKVMEK